MLETRFPRIPGDIGNPATFRFPVLYEVVPGASAARVVHGQARGLIDAFIAAGRRLVDRGAAAIMTSCGFLAEHQTTLATALAVPVASSSLLQVGMVGQLLPPGKRVGILTISARDLGPAQLRAVKAPIDTPVGGLPRQSHFASVFLDDGPTLDRQLAESEVLAAADDLRRQHPDVGALVLECTNMGPFTATLAKQTGLAVFDVVSLADWLHAGLAARHGAADSRFLSPAGKSTSRR
jgi:Asp/Glu/hydantoin racemase